MGDGEAGEEEGSEDVGVDHGVVVLDAGVDEVFVDAHANVVDEDVDGSELQCGGDALFRDRLFLGVAWDGGDAARASGEGELGELVEAVLAAAGDDEVGAFFRESQCAGPADASAGSGDDCSFAA